MKILGPICRPWIPAMNETLSCDRYDSTQHPISHYFKPTRHLKLILFQLHDYDQFPSWFFSRYVSIRPQKSVPLSTKRLISSFEHLIFTSSSIFSPIQFLNFPKLFYFNFNLFFISKSIKSKMIKHKWLFDASDESTSFEIGQSATRVYPKMISHPFKKENES